MTFTPEDALPEIVALFLATFDVKLGYTLKWSRSIIDDNDTTIDPPFRLHDVVEYKVFPAGTHRVIQDLIYFSHDLYTGVSVFSRQAATLGERGARFVSLGVLLPPNEYDSDKPCRAWLYAAPLRLLLNSFLNHCSDVDLQQFWEAHRVSQRAVASASFSLPPFVSLGIDELCALTLINGADKPGRRYSFQSSIHSFHPIRSLFKLFTLFGPLVFPLHRLTLLQKRLLILASPPLREPCEYVYCLALLSGLPTSHASSIANSFVPSSMRPCRPLYNVVVHDIPYLTDLAQDYVSCHEQSRRGWIACTSDKIIADKTALYDILIQLPYNVTEGSRRTWPIITSQGTPEGATQGDIVRFRALYPFLKSVYQETAAGETSVPNEPDDSKLCDTKDTSPLLNTSHSDKTNPGFPSVESIRQTLEPLPWGHFMYQLLGWWDTQNYADQSEGFRELMLSSCIRRLTGQGKASIGVSITGKMCDCHVSQLCQTSYFAYFAIVSIFHRLTWNYLCLTEQISANINGNNNSTINSQRSLPSDPVMIIQPLSKSTSFESTCRQRNKTLDSEMYDAEHTTLQDGAVTDELSDVVWIDSLEMRRMELNPWCTTETKFLKDFMRINYDINNIKIRSPILDFCGSCNFI